MGQDRVDVQFAVKEVRVETGRAGLEEREEASGVLERWLENKFQELPEKVVVWTDTDFAEASVREGLPQEAW